jgi:hypothetical protein
MALNGYAANDNAPTLAELAKAAEDEIEGLRARVAELEAEVLVHDRTEESLHDAETERDEAEARVEVLEAMLAELGVSDVQIAYAAKSADVGDGLRAAGVIVPAGMRPRAGDTSPVLPEPVRAWRLL